MAGGLIPERLVTIRRYSSTEPAVAACRLLLDEGIEAYIRTYRWQDTGEVRVPESEVERALALLPAADSLEGSDEVERCRWCGSRDARVVAPFTTVLGLAGVGLIAWEIYSRRIDGAVVAAVLVLLIVAMTKMAAGRLVCMNCGQERRAPRAAPDPEHEREHERRTENPEV